MLSEGAFTCFVCAGHHAMVYLFFDQDCTLKNDPHIFRAMSIKISSNIEFYYSTIRKPAILSKGTVLIRLDMDWLNLSPDQIVQRAKNLLMFL